MLRTAVLLAAAAIPLPARGAGPGDDLAKAVSFYASFDDEVRGDVGNRLTLRTRSGFPDKGDLTFEDGFNAKVFRVARGKGVSGGALEVTDVLPNNGRVFFPVKGHLAYKKGGWGGAVSVWCNTDPNTSLKTKFCDPIQITQKGANNGGIWFDFNDAKPRDLRHGAFPALAGGEKPVSDDDPKAPMVRVPRIDWKAGDWHHVVLSWKNFDTGKPDAVSALYIDGKLIGEVKDRAVAMGWDVDRAGVYVGVNYIGLLDELALFNRALTADEVKALHKQPALLAPLKKKAPAEKRGALPGRLRELAKQVDALPVTGPAPEALRAQLLDYLAGAEGRAVAESCLALQLRLPPRSATAPKAPKFPFDTAEARRYQKEYAAWLGLPAEFVNGLGMAFVLVPPGTFLMGSPDDEPGRNATDYNEGPRHEVTLTRPFYLGKHEVTVGQFRRFVAATGHVSDGEKNGGGNAHDDKAVWKHRAGTSWKSPGYAGPYTLRDEHPVVHVSHADAEAFCRWLGETCGTAAGWKYGLPTEAQWEWACRAGSGARYWWGPDEDTTGKVLNVGDRSLKRVHPDWPRTVMAMDDGHAFVAPVGSYAANGFGLHDMLGNVWEHCATRFGPYPKGPVTDPEDGDLKRGFAVRGGGWSNVAADARCATRNADPPHFCHSNLGFRAALAIPSRPAVP
jgi:formylglycine-generating enzyme required for sulfatase activity